MHASMTQNVRTGYNPSPMDAMDEPRIDPSRPPQSPVAPSGPLAGTGSAAARVYAHVKERLLDGSFPGGVLLSENELSQQLGLSRTPVRQAFVQLEAEGLLELYPKRGALVVPVAASEIEDVFEARLLVEEHCARRAATAGGRPLATELAEAIAEQEAAIAMGQGGGAGGGPPRAGAGGAHRGGGGGVGGGRGGGGGFPKSRPPLPSRDRRRRGQRDPHAPLRRAARPPAPHRRRLARAQPRRRRA